MGRTATQQQRSPLPATQNTELKQPAVTEDRHKATTHHEAASRAIPKREPQQPNITEDAIRLRAYELDLERGAIPGNEADDWLRAERELLAD